MNWTRALPVPLTPSGASAFEHLVLKLGFSPGHYQDSIVLREWVQKNKNYRYVPSELLQAWGLKVDVQGAESNPDAEPEIQNNARTDAAFGALLRATIGRKS